MPHSNDLKLAAAAATDRILLAEYTEEHPVYLNRPGMAMHIVDYAHADAPPPDATPPAARHPAATASGDSPRVTIGDAPRVTAPTGTRREVSDSAPLPLALGAKVNDGGVRRVAVTNLAYSPAHDHKARRPTFILTRVERDGRVFFQAREVSY